jgi:hypothetical protein
MQVKVDKNTFFAYIIILYYILYFFSIIYYINLL